MTQYLYSAESVAEGHPDKLCDRISDTVLDAVLEKDRFARAIVETVVTRGLVLLTGELTTKTYVDLDRIVRGTLRQVGYDDPETGFDHRACAVVSLLREQSEQIAAVVDGRKAGDQGMMVGFATDEAAELGTDTALMPMPIATAHALMRRLRDVRRNGTLPWLRPDGKCQVTFVYENRIPRRLASVSLSAQHAPEADVARVRKEVEETVIMSTLADLGLTRENDARIEVNPAGPFVAGGPATDAGLTGRKIVVDSYGSMAHHGGAALSGKDPTKLDRSATYAARWVARSVVEAGLARRCEVDLAYTLGREQPECVRVETFGTGVVADEELAEAVTRTFDLTLPGILTALDLLRPIYAETSVFGHFGRADVTFPWERSDEAAALSAYFEKGDRS
jgi:S-adenosylmethionine synthetase